MMDIIEIDKLKAGQDLDILVAEKVMGWKQKTGDLWQGVSPIVLWLVNDNPLYVPRTPHKRFTPSTDIASAWMVVEKISGDEMFWEAENDFPEEWDCETSYDFRIIHHGIDYESVMQRTLPLAICKATLKAVMELEGVK